MTTPSATTTSDPHETMTLSVKADGAEALRKAEWLLTNGAGGYAMATPPVGRVVVLSQVVDELILHGTDGRPDQRLDLSSLLFRSGEDTGLIHAPGGYASLQRCDRGATVSWTYTLGPVQVVRELELNDLVPAATVRWRRRRRGDRHPG